MLMKLFLVAKRSKLNVQVNYEHVIYMWFFSLVKL